MSTIAIMVLSCLRGCYDPSCLGLLGVLFGIGRTGVMSLPSRAGEGEAEVKKDICKRFQVMDGAMSFRGS